MAKSLSLTGLRIKIARSILRTRFLKREEVYWGMCEKLAREIYLDTYNVPLIQSLPKGWLPEETHIYCDFGLDHGKVKLYFNGYPFLDRDPLYWTPVSRPHVYYAVPNNYMTSYKVYNKDFDRIVSIYENFRLNIRCYVEEFNKAYADTHNLLESFDTVDQFIKAHPYLESHVENLVPCT